MRRHGMGGSRRSVWPCHREFRLGRCGGSWFHHPNWAAFLMRFLSGRKRRCRRDTCKGWYWTFTVQTSVYYHRREFDWCTVQSVYMSSIHLLHLRPQFHSAVYLAQHYLQVNRPANVTSESSLKSVVILGSMGILFLILYNSYNSPLGSSYLSFVERSHSSTNVLCNEICGFRFNAFTGCFFRGQGNTYR